MTTKEKEKAAFISEMQRVHAKLGRDSLTMAEYREHHAPGFSIDAMSRRGWTFNEVKKMAGLTVFAKSKRRGVESRRRYEGKYKKPEPTTGEKRRCNKCNKPYLKTPQNRIICPKCVKHNHTVFTDGAGTHMNGNDVYCTWAEVKV